MAFGLFVTRKNEPNDVDVFLVMADDFDASPRSGEASRLPDHDAAQVHLFLAEIDRMQLEVREHLSLHPGELKARA